MEDLTSLNVLPIQSVGQGAFKLKDSDEKTWYRLMYLARVQDTIDVLACFEKDTARTERKDLNRAKARLAAVRQRILEKRKNAKRKRNE